ncbi:hypothetical protein FB45DRAFT_1006634 [Roridomyces roridus]|uniref:phytol kinase n=1 Tax=Roridomyces roridus TaxID=1738132 RepID=A0AAD7BHX5_9AGAR|nr:hypothetical protein FB45DRAFT_1006634 [Roridomyces roridus]
MHECLRLSALQSLPVSIRRYAQLAASDSGSTESLGRVVTVMTRPENLSKLIFLLPLVFRLLDPARIPSSDSELTPAEKAAYHETMLSLDALAQTNNVPGDVAPEIWSRVWRWFLFLDRYHKVHEDAALERVACSRVVSCAASLARHPGMGDMVRSTPGLYATVMRAWIAALYLRDTSVDYMHYSARLLGSVSSFVADTNLLDKETLEMFIDDHDPADIGMWALRHGDFALELFQDPQLKHLGWGFSLALLAFVRIVLDVAENLPVHELPSRLLIEFVNQGIVEFLVRAAHGFATIRIPQENSASALRQILQLLQKLVYNKELYPFAWSAAFTGFLGCVAVCAQHADLFQDMHTELKGILSQLLPPCTIHIGDGTGARLVFAIAQHEHMLPTRLVALLKDRAALAQSLKSPEIVKMKACDNVMCTMLGPKHEFKCCSGCSTLHYCSVSCQAADWQSGHRNACKTYDHLLNLLIWNTLPKSVLWNDPRGSPESLSPLQMEFGGTPNFIPCERLYCIGGRVPYISSRQRYFMRALLDRDYKHLKLHVFSKAVERMRASGDPHAGYFVIFNYLKGKPELGVHSITQPSDLQGNAQWEEAVARAAKSGGRITIHAITVREATDARQWILPLCSDSGKIHDELTRNGVGDAAGYDEKVDELENVERRRVEHNETS